MSSNSLRGGRAVAVAQPAASDASIPKASRASAVLNPAPACPVRASIPSSLVTRCRRGASRLGGGPASSLTLLGRQHQAERHAAALGVVDRRPRPAELAQADPVDARELHAVPHAEPPHRGRTLL